MYCKHCGKEITEDSTFCNHCGKSQGANCRNITSKPVWIVYGMWFVANLYLLMGEKHINAFDYFFPFTVYPKHDYYGDTTYSDYFDKTCYDFSEFAVYVFILPAILYIIYRWLNKPINEVINKIVNK